MEYMDLPDELKTELAKGYSAVSGKPFFTLEEIFNLCLETVDKLTEDASLVIYQDGDYLVKQCACGHIKQASLDEYSRDFSCQSCADHDCDMNNSIKKNGG